jgi:hypothetical protein
VALLAAAVVYALQPRRPAPGATAQAQPTVAEIRPFTIPAAPSAPPDPAATLEPIPVEALPVATTPAVRQPWRPPATAPAAAAHRAEHPESETKESATTSKKKVIDDGF